MPKMGSSTHSLSKNVYNDVLCINGSKVTALNVFSQPQRLHRPYVLFLESPNLSFIAWIQ